MLILVSTNMPRLRRWQGGRCCTALMFWLRGTAACRKMFFDTDFTD
jgi:hypothetical protein